MATVLNGVTVEPSTGAIMAGNAYFFKAYSLSSASYVYDNAGDTDANAGWIPTGGAINRVIQYSIASPTGTVTLTITGKIGVSLETNIVTITSASATTGLINIAENVDQIRIGLKISAGSATVSVTGRFTGMTFASI